MLTLIRHAESSANAGLVTHDPASIPLTSAGEAQARQLAESALPSPVIAVWSSPYLRSLQTASPTAERFGLVVQQQPLQEFTYLCPGKCAGTTPAERKQWVDEYWRRGDPDYVDGPGAESFSMLVERAYSALSLFDSGTDEAHVIAFSHGQFLQMIFWLGRFSGTPASRAGMRAYRDLDMRRPIRHCEGIRIPRSSVRSGRGVERWPELETQVR
ncbi:histidine phosphatase family protein [Stenotrophomonas forensis]|uniref:Histidine phosphatase family protein n=1 Tax=Stenotrophomonas forensis TaxID=2871169 RepID=A0ABY7XU86_9GAMM|nr:histidine phosphatase family protein [Stenotrophomonas sp. DFS-20110405]